MTANQPAMENKAEVLTLTGMSALAAMAALVTLTLILVGLAISRTRSKYTGYQMIVKGPPAGGIELQRH